MPNHRMVVAYQRRENNARELAHRLETAMVKRPPGLIHDRSYVVEPGPLRLWWKVVKHYSTSH